METNNKGQFVSNGQYLMKLRVNSIELGDARQETYDNPDEVLDALDAEAGWLSETDGIEILEIIPQPFEKVVKVLVSGAVLGHLWGGGEGTYEARHFESKSLIDAVREVKRTLADGSLDGGMGFESLISADIEFYVYYEIRFDDKVYQRTEYFNKQFVI